MSTPASPVSAAPAPPSAPAAAAPAASPSPAPAAAPSPVPAAAPAAAPAHVPAAVPAAAPAGTPAKFDAKVSAAPPKSSDYPDNQQGIVDFISDNSAWSQAHPEEAERIRTAKIGLEDDPQASPEAAAAAASPVAEQVAKVEGEPEVKPAAAATSATPAKIDEWTSKSAELKAAFEKNPELQREIMETARFAESAKPVLDIIGTPEEAQFAVDHANRLVTLQANWMLGAEDPEMIGSAWDQTVDMFKERDKDGNEVKGADGKPVLGADFKPFVTKAAVTAISPLRDAAQAQIEAVEARLKGSYPNDEARAADDLLVKDIQYQKAAFDWVLDQVGKPAGDGPKLPALPANATPEQVAYQKELERQQSELDVKQGKQTAESRKTATKTLNREVQNTYEKSINDGIDAEVAAMRARGEFVSDLVLNDKWVNPQTGQPGKITDFGARIYLDVNNKINSNPLHVAKLRNLEAMGAAGKDARIAEMQRLTRLYLPNVIESHRWRLQAGSGAKAAVPASEQVARVEPQSAGTATPAAMDTAQVRTWAEGEAAKEPGYESMDSRMREALIIRLQANKKYGG